MPQLFTNNAASALAGAITDVATSIVVTAGHGAKFPSPSGGDYFLATLIGLDGNGVETSWEIVKCTGRAVDTLTVVRAQEGTTGVAWGSGARIELRPTAGTLGLFGQIPVTAANGGTGQTTYTIGDILYASGAAALSKLAGVATGNALISGGVGTAPSWGKVGLTTHVSGTLPVANGGTGVATLTGIVKANGTNAFAAATAGTDYAKPDTASSWTAEQTFKELTETVYTITDAAGVQIDPANGSVQVWTLTASRTPQATNFASGQSVTLMIADGTAYTVTWTTIGVVWVGGSAPALAASGYTVVVLWKVGNAVYGIHAGDVA